MKNGGLIEGTMKKLSIYTGSKRNTGSEMMSMIDDRTIVTIKKALLY
jgi:hypothetical protein